MCSWKLKHSKSGVAAEDETRWKTINPMKLLNLPLHYLQVYVYESKHCKGKRRSHWGSFQKQWWSWLNYFRLSVSYTFFPPFPVSSQKKTKMIEHALPVTGDTQLSFFRVSLLPFLSMSNVQKMELRSILSMTLAVSKTCVYLSGTNTKNNREQLSSPHIKLSSSA